MHTKMARTDSTEYFNLVKNMLFRILKMIATSGFLTALECTKCVFGGGAHDAPPDPLIGGEGDTPPQEPHPLVAYGDELSSPTATRPLEPPLQILDPPLYYM